MTSAVRRHPDVSELRPGDAGLADEGGWLRIGQVADRLGVSASALRQWERQGLVQPRRTATGYRLYSKEDLDRLMRVRRMRQEHINAPGIRQILARTRATSSGGRPQGPRLRALRHQHRLSLREAGRRAGLSVSFLSALERGETGASVATMQRLTAAYGVTMLDLFAPGAAAGRRVTPRQRPVLDLEGTGVRIEQLAAGSTSLEPQLFVLGPGSSSDGAYSHAGEEFLFVLDGELTFWVGDRERYRLRAGDALTFPSNLPHRWRNRAGGETRLLWINTPPTF